MEDADAVLLGQGLAWLGHLAVAHPRWGGLAILVVVIFGAWGVIGANAPTDILRAKGWRRSADFFDAGAVWGLFAWDVVSRIRKRLAARKDTAT